MIMTGLSELAGGLVATSRQSLSLNGCAAPSKAVATFLEAALTAKPFAHGTLDLHLAAIYIRCRFLSQSIYPGLRSLDLSLNRLGTKGSKVHSQRLAVGSHFFSVSLRAVVGIMVESQ